MSKSLFVGERVKNAREHAGYSQATLAFLAFMGVRGEDSISRIERNLVATSELDIAALSKALDVDSGWLRNGCPASEPTKPVRVPGLGNAIRAARLAAGMSARRLSETAGLGSTSQNVLRLENGDHYPRGVSLQRICEVLGVPGTRLIANAA